MKFLKKRNLAMLLGGATAGFIGLLATLAILRTPQAWASPGYDMDCTLCHTKSTAITITTDITSTKTVAPGTSFNVNLSWSGGGTYTEVTWPNVVDNAKFVTATPLIAYSGSKASGTATSTLKAPTTAGTYTVRVYASTMTTGRITNYTDMTISVSSAPTAYTITASAGSNGSISPSGAVSVNSGSNQSFAITPATGYHVAGVLVDGSSVGAVSNYTFNNVTTTHTISATFAINTYTLTYTAGANGTLTGTASQTVNYNTSGTAVTAVANTGYHFVSWSDGKTANPRTDSSVTANVAVTANFAINTYTLSYTAGANGTLTGTVSQTVNYNASGTAVTAVPNTGYHFVNWSDGKTANPRTDASVTANVNVTANFAANTVTNYTLTYTAGANGSISGTASQTVASGGSGTAVTAVPNTGYHFVDWSDSSTANPRTDSNVTASISVTANFAIDTHTITVTSGANGTITPGTETVNHASDATFTITADTGYHIASIVVDGSPLVTSFETTPTATYTFTNVTSNHTISATFAADAPATDSVGPITSKLKISPKITKRNNPTDVTLTALVDDSATGNSSVAGAEYWIDSGPHLAMVASVGATLDSPIEQLTATINLASLTPGRHIVYVRGQDSYGNWGPAARIGFRVIASSSPSSSATQFKATAESSDDDWNEYAGDTADEIEVDENSKGDVIQIVDHLTSGQNITLWPNGSSEYTDLH